MKDSTYINIAHEIAKESKCIQRKVGAVIVKNDYMIGSGYNGTARGLLNCCDVNADNHHEWSKDNEIHAEMNAIIQVARSTESLEGATLYTTLSPCKQCALNISNSGIVKVVYDELYPRSDLSILEKVGIEVKQVKHEN